MARERNLLLRLVMSAVGQENLADYGCKGDNNSSRPERDSGPLEQNPLTVCYPLVSGLALMRSRVGPGMTGLINAVILDKRSAIQDLADEASEPVKPPWASGLRS